MRVYSNDGSRHFSFYLLSFFVLHNSSLPDLRLGLGISFGHYQEQAAADALSDSLSSRWLSLSLDKWEASSLSGVKIVYSLVRYPTGVYCMLLLYAVVQ